MQRILVYCRLKEYTDGSNFEEHLEIFKSWVTDRYTFKQLNTDCCEYFKLKVSSNAINLYDGLGNKWRADYNILSTISSKLTIESREIHFIPDVIQKRYSVPEKLIYNDEKNNIIECKMIENTLWRLYKFYCASGGVGYGNDGSLPRRQWTHFVNDCCINVPLSQINVIYNSRVKYTQTNTASSSSNKHENLFEDKVKLLRNVSEFEFDDFLTALLDLSLYLYKNHDATPEIKLGQMLHEFVLPLTKKRQWGRETTEWVNFNNTILTAFNSSLFKIYIGSLRLLYEYFADVEVVRGLASEGFIEVFKYSTKKHRKCFMMSLKSFRNFVSTFNFFSKDLTSKQITMLYLCCSEDSILGSSERDGGDSDVESIAAAISTDNDNNNNNNNISVQKKAPSPIKLNDKKDLSSSGKEGNSSQVLSCDAFIELLFRCCICVHDFSKVPQSTSSNLLADALIKIMMQQISFGINQNTFSNQMNKSKLCSKKSLLSTAVNIFRTNYLNMWHLDGSPLDYSITSFWEGKSETSEMSTVDLYIDDLDIKVDRGTRNRNERSLKNFMEKRKIKTEMNFKKVVSTANVLRGSHHYSMSSMKNDTISVARKKSSISSSSSSYTSSNTNHHYSNSNSSVEGITIDRKNSTAPLPSSSAKLLVRKLSGASTSLRKMSFVTAKTTSRRMSTSTRSKISSPFDGLMNPESYNLNSDLLYSNSKMNNEVSCLLKGDGIFKSLIDVVFNYYRNIPKHFPSEGNNNNNDNNNNDNNNNDNNNNICYGDDQIDSSFIETFKRMWNLALEYYEISLYSIETTRDSPMAQPTEGYVDSDSHNYKNNKTNSILYVHHLLHIASSMLSFGKLLYQITTVHHHGHGSPTTVGASNFNKIEELKVQMSSIFEKYIFDAMLIACNKFTEGEIIVTENAANNELNLMNHVVYYEWATSLFSLATLRVSQEERKLVEITNNNPVKKNKTQSENNDTASSCIINTNSNIAITSTDVVTSDGSLSSFNPSDRRKTNLYSPINPFQNYSNNNVSCETPPASEYYYDYCYDKKEDSNRGIFSNVTRDNDSDQHYLMISRGKKQLYTDDDLSKPTVTCESLYTEAIQRFRKSVDLYKHSNYIDDNNNASTINTLNSSNRNTSKTAGNGPTLSFCSPALIGWARCELAYTRILESPTKVRQLLVCALNHAELAQQVTSNTEDSTSIKSISSSHTTSGSGNNRDINPTLTEQQHQDEESEGIYSTTLYEIKAKLFIAFTFFRVIPYSTTSIVKPHSQKKDLSNGKEAKFLDGSSIVTSSSTNASSSLNGLSKAHNSQNPPLRHRNSNNKIEVTQRNLPRNDGSTVEFTRTPEVVVNGSLYYPTCSNDHYSLYNHIESGVFYNWKLAQNHNFLPSLTHSALSALKEVFYRCWEVESNGYLTEASMKSFCQQSKLMNETIEEGLHWVEMYHKNQKVEPAEYNSSGLMSACTSHTKKDFPSSLISPVRKMVNNGKADVTVKEEQIISDKLSVKKSDNEVKMKVTNQHSSSKTHGRFNFNSFKTFFSWLGMVDYIQLYSALEAMDLINQINKIDDFIRENRKIKSNKNNIANDDISNNNNNDNMIDLKDHANYIELSPKSDTSSDDGDGLVTSINSDNTVISRIKSESSLSGNSIRTRNNNGNETLIAGFILEEDHDNKKRLSSGNSSISDVKNIISKTVSMHSLDDAQFVTTQRDKPHIKSTLMSSSSSPNFSIHKASNDSKTEVTSDMTHIASEQRVKDTSNTPLEVQSIYEEPENVVARLSDYFVVIERGELLDDVVISNSESPKDLLFHPKLCDRIPNVDHDGSSIPDEITLFCFPNGVRLRVSPLEPKIFHTVLTNSHRTEIYVSALHFYEPVKPNEINEIFERSTSQHQQQQQSGSYHNQNEKQNQKLQRQLYLPSWVTKLNRECIHRKGSQNLHSTSDENHSKDDSITSTTTNDISNDTGMTLFTPKCICIVSHWPLFNIYQTVLKQFLRLSCSKIPLPLERYISNFIYDVPLPPRGQIEIQYTIADETVFISRPAVDDLPLCNVEFALLFRVLDLSNIIALFTCLLTEQKIAIKSKNNALLTHVCESLRALMFPFKWQGWYIPVIPSHFDVFDLLNSPVPFLVGFNRNAMEENEIVDDVVFVDIDENIVFYNIGDYFPRLPDKQYRKLLNTLKKNVVNMFNPTHPSVENVDKVFFNEDETILRKQHGKNASSANTSAESKLSEDINEFKVHYPNITTTITIPPITEFNNECEMGKISSTTLNSNIDGQSSTATSTSAAMIGTKRHQDDGMDQPSSDSVSLHLNKQHHHNTISHEKSINHTTGSNTTASSSTAATINDGSAKIEQRYHFSSNYSSTKSSVIKRNATTSKLTMGVNNNTKRMKSMSFYDSSRLDNIGFYNNTNSKHYPAHFNPRAVREAFLRVSVSLLRNYRKFMSIESASENYDGDNMYHQDDSNLPRNSNNNNNNNHNNQSGKNINRPSRSSSRGSGDNNSEIIEETVLFDKEGFLSDRGINSKSFLSQVCDTQSFQMFLQYFYHNSKTDPGVVLFNTCIDRKKKRKWRNRHVDLLDPSVKPIGKLFIVSAPDPVGLREGEWRYSRFPTKLRHDLLPSPVVVAPLLVKIFNQKKSTKGLVEFHNNNNNDNLNSTDIDDDALNQIAATNRTTAASSDTMHQNGSVVGNVNYSSNIVKLYNQSNQNSNDVIIRENNSLDSISFDDNNYTKNQNGIFRYCKRIVEDLILKSVIYSDTKTYYMNIQEQTVVQLKDARDRIKRMEEQLWVTQVKRGELVLSSNQHQKQPLSIIPRTNPISMRNNNNSDIPTTSTITAGGGTLDGMNHALMKLHQMESEALRDRIVRIKDRNQSREDALSAEIVALRLTIEGMHDQLVHQNTNNNNNNNNNIINNNHNSDSISSIRDGKEENNDSITKSTSRRNRGEGSLKSAPRNHSRRPSLLNFTICDHTNNSNNNNNNNNNVSDSIEPHYSYYWLPFVLKYLSLNEVGTLTCVSKLWRSICSDINVYMTLVTNSAPNSCQRFAFWNKMIIKSVSAAVSPEPLQINSFTSLSGQYLPFVPKYIHDDISKVIDQVGSSGIFQWNSSNELLSPTMISMPDWPKSRVRSLLYQILYTVSMMSSDVSDVEGINHIASFCLKWAILSTSCNIASTIHHENNIIRNNNIHFDHDQDTTSSSTMILYDNIVQTKVTKLIRRILCERNLVCLYKGDLSGLHVALVKLQKLLKYYLPNLSKHLEAKGITAYHYAGSWFLTLFTDLKTLSFDVVTRIWDAYVIEGIDLIYKVSLTILSELQEKLFNKSKTSILLVLNRVSTHLESKLTSDNILHSANNFKLEGII